MMIISAAREPIASALRYFGTVRVAIFIRQGEAMRHAGDIIDSHDAHRWRILKL